MGKAFREFASLIPETEIEIEISQFCFGNERSEIPETKPVQFCFGNERSEIPETKPVLFRE
jgi:hypothetical protein